MRILYNISIWLLCAVMWLARPFVLKARQRAAVKPAKIDTFGKKVILVHCASLGEFEQGRPLIEALRAQFPDKYIVLTFFSPSGYEQRKNFAGVDAVRYLPLDTPRAARRFANELKPEMAFFVKYEYWYNILRALYCCGTKIYLVSAIFRPDANFFYPVWRGGNFFRSILGFYHRIFVQMQSSADLLAGIGVTQSVIVAGDTRFDRVASLANTAKELPIIEKFAAEKFTVVCGSTWGPDEDILLDLMAAHPDWNFVVAPHEIVRNRIDKFVAASGRQAIIYTENGAADNANLLVIDCIGILSSAYRYGNIAYVGGGFGAGIHNTLEAGAWGVPVVFGPKYQKFAEACALIDAGAGFSVNSSEELLSVFDKLALTYKDCGAVAGNFVKQSIGATEHIISFVVNVNNASK